MKNILIITSSFDLVADHLISKFKNRANFFRFNTDFFWEYSIDISDYRRWNISSKYWTINEQNLFSIYYTKSTVTKFEECESSYNNVTYEDVISTIDKIVEVFNGRCLSKPSLLIKADNKIFQLRIAEQINFKIPKSLIINSINPANKFCNNKIRIIRSLSMKELEFQNKVGIIQTKVGIIQTNIIDNNIEINRLENPTTYCPQYISKDYDVRVIIVNKSCHAVKIENKEKTDWKKYDSSNIYSKIVLPETIKEKCFKMLKKLDLNFGTFDFSVNEGEFIFLEINANGQWYWLEEKLNLSISEDIFAFLEGANK